MTITINGTTGITNDGGYTGDGVVFADTTPANTLVTTTGGNVGIGTSSPTSRLTIKQSADNSAAGLGARIERNGNDSFLAVGYRDNSDSWQINATYSSTGSFKPITFHTSDAERARIDSSGNLLVGTTSGLGKLTLEASPGNLTTPNFSSRNNSSVGGSYALHFNVLNSSGSQVGYISANGTATFYATSSDYRLKNTIAPMTGALAKVIALKPCTYKWNSDGSEGEGFIAHELAEVCPKAVSGEKDAVDAEGNPVYQGIDTSFLVATLTAAIQEQQAIILAQESALNALTARVAALEASLDARLTSLEGTQP